MTKTEVISLFIVIIDPMYKFAQIIPAGFDGTLCTLNYDQSTVISNTWLAMLLSCLVLGTILFILNQRKYSVLFYSYIVALLFARLVNPTNDCGHGGLFEFTDSNILMFGAVLLIILLPSS